MEETPEFENRLPEPSKNTRLASVPDDAKMTPVRKKVIELRNSFALADIARATNYSVPTLSAWANGKYNGASEKIEAAVLKWLIRIGEQPEGGAVETQPFLETPNQRAVFWTITMALEQRALTAVIGKPGLGKTASIIAWCKQARQDGIRHVAVTCDVTMQNSPLAILRRIADELRIERARTSTELLDAICEKLRSDDYLIIIDEAQHLGLRPLEAIRSIHDKATAGIALLGSQALEYTLVTPRRHSELKQLQDRLLVVKYLQPLAPIDLSRFVDDWWGSPVPEPVKSKLRAISGGNPRRLCRVLTHARAMCRLSKGSLTVEIVDSANALLFRSTEEEN
jgi:DNA transposition AAA+ family ATPase